MGGLNKELEALKKQLQATEVALESRLWTWPKPIAWQVL